MWVSIKVKRADSTEQLRELGALQVLQRAVASDHIVRQFDDIAHQNRKVDIRLNLSTEIVKSGKEGGSGLVGHMPKPTAKQRNLRLPEGNQLIATYDTLFVLHVTESSIAAWLVLKVVDDPSYRDRDIRK
ncbi:hypothetical protein B0O99DRAFT_601976 [Bisporella sp. PMI_857]|nr:hypothetical protein B0O99DRAFT_601976 [Bisporella sp. PMI_857]